LNKNNLLIQANHLNQKTSRFEKQDHLIIQIWQDLVCQSIHSRASDIHIEAGEAQCPIRLRIDGNLYLHQELSKEICLRLVTRIKILARLDIAEQRLPQDGRLRIGLNADKPNLDCRVSSLPTLYGEKIVLRILSSSLQDLDLHRLGFFPSQLVQFKKAINHPNGLILVTGPTGSGKTRTLYSALHYLNDSSRNICSVEDPIEMRLDGVNQVAFHPKAGLHFDLIIRAILRQDPDVIMIGEIRDSITAKLAIQAAQTGHLVLSTLHTQDAISAINRLEYLGIPIDLIANCLICITAQRLVKKICKACLSTDAKSNPTNCLVCKGNGYFGRTGIHEVLTVSPNLAIQITNKISSQELRRLSQNEGFTSLDEATEILVKQGVIDSHCLIQANSLGR